MAINPKNKGNSFERKIANQLSDRFIKQTGIPQSFRRNPDSGSFFGGGNKKRTETHDLDHASFGDLICPNNFRFTIECKHYKSAPTFSAIVKGSVKQWDDWIIQAKADASSAGKDLMLVVKYNQVPTIAFVQDTFYLPCVFKYSGLMCYEFDQLLSLDDSNFFKTVD